MVASTFHKVGIGVIEMPQIFPRGRVQYNS